MSSFSFIWLRSEAATRVLICQSDVHEMFSRKIQKRKYRLVAATEDAFAHVQGVQASATNGGKVNGHFLLLILVHSTSLTLSQSLLDYSSSFLTKILYCSC